MDAIGKLINEHWSFAIFFLVAGILGLVATVITLADYFRRRSSLADQQVHKPHFSRPHFPQQNQEAKRPQLVYQEAQTRQGEPAKAQPQKARPHPAVQPAQTLEEQERLLCEIKNDLEAIHTEFASSYPNYWPSRHLIVKRLLAKLTRHLASYWPCPPEEFQRKFRQAVERLPNDIGHLLLRTTPHHHFRESNLPKYLFDELFLIYGLLTACENSDSFPDEFCREIAHRLFIVICHVRDLAEDRRNGSA